MKVLICISWITISVIIGLLGRNRKIGFWGGFLSSIILSPIVGFFVTFFSKTFKEQKLEQEMLEYKKERARLLAEISENKMCDKSEDHIIRIADDIEELLNLKEKGLLSEDEFQEAKQRLLL